MEITDLEDRYALLWLNGAIGPRLLLMHIGFQRIWKSSTLYDLEGHWQPVRSARPILATAWLLVSI